MFEKVGGFSALPREHLIRLEAISREISVRKGSILFSPGDRSQGFYAVSKGAVRLYRVSSKGKEITLEIADAGSTFAEASIFSEIYHCYAEALSHSTIHLIGKAAFLEMIQGDILFAVTWIRILSLEVIHHRQRIEELSLKSPRARIVSYLLLLAEMQSCTSVTLPVHRKSIATLLGMTHETFYRTARELELEGLVRFDGQRLEIINRPLLEELVD